MRDLRERQGRCGHLLRPRWMLRVTLLALFGGSVGLAQDPSAVRTWSDPPYDVVARRTDLGATAPFDPVAHGLVELIEIRMGRWMPDDPQIDIFAGTYSQGGVFFRLDVVVAGLVNPPGKNSAPGFDPFRYGPHPVYGFIEIDMDDDHETGGEIDAPEFRYLGNIARFGGLPEEEVFDERVAVDASAFDGDFLTEPYVERHGEEFHLALLGGQFSNQDIVETVGDGDLVFEAGESWVIEGQWFHRAHGFEMFSVASGGGVQGEYAPVCSLLFAHDAFSDRTDISLVFPLTNGAWAAQHGQSAEPMNHDPSDQASINEALRDLVISAGIVALFPTGMPEEALILPWKDKTAGDYLDPIAWRPTALLGTTYTSPGPFFVWTDALPNVIRGNVNGEHGADDDDVSEIESYISAHDGDDGATDGRVVIGGFAEDFSVFDVNHDGVVDDGDVTLVSVVGDGDGDDDVDLADFALLQQCFGGAAPSGSCLLTDLDNDNDVDERDLAWFEGVLTGPGGL